MGGPFISYSHKDKFAGILITQWCRDAGLEPFRDEEDFPAGHQFTESERKFIRKCNLFVALLTSDWLESVHCRGELRIASESRKKVLFVQLEPECLPPVEYRGERALCLLSLRPDIWHRSLVSAIRSLAPGNSKQPTGVHQRLSAEVGQNELVKSRAAQQGMQLLHLLVGSCVELACKPSGWKQKDIHIHELGDFVPEEEGIDATPGSASPNGEPNNYAVDSFLEDLTDEPWLTLNLRRVSHMTVRAVANALPRALDQAVPGPRLFDRNHLAYAHSLVAHLALLTSDRYLMVGLRSDRPRFYENCWSATYEEHVTPSQDGGDPFCCAVRGLREEILGHRAPAVAPDAVRFYSLFRELDSWTKSATQESFVNVNVGLGGTIDVPISVEAVLRAWVEHQADPYRDPEFDYLVGIPYTFENLYDLLTTRDFDPSDHRWSGIVVHPPQGETGSRKVRLDPGRRLQHPTNQIRLARCLTADYFMPLERQLGVVA